MAGVNRELQVNKQPWLEPELKLILKSLGLKLEKKIFNDVESDLSSLSHSNVIEKDSQNSVLDVSGQKLVNDSAVKKVMKSCLSLIKFLQYEGDIEFVNNKSHHNIIETIDRTFENREEVMRAYSKSLVRIIQKEKNGVYFKQDMIA